MPTKQTNFTVISKYLAMRIPQFTAISSDFEPFYNRNNTLKSSVALSVAPWIQALLSFEPIVNRSNGESLYNYIELESKVVILFNKVSNLIYLYIEYRL